MSNRPLSTKIRHALADERGNCFLYGCVTVVILCLLGGLVAFLTLRYAMQQVREKFTAEAPIELPTVQMDQTAINSLIERVDKYADDLRGDDALEPITLTEPEINALLQNHPDLKETYGDHVYLTLAENAVTAQMSLPLDWLPLFRERYFNGTATFDVAFSNGRFQIYLDSASVKGEDVPSEQLREFRRENFGDMWEDDPDARELIREIETVSISQEGVTITPKTGAPPGLIPEPQDSDKTPESPETTVDSPSEAESAEETVTPPA